MLEQHTIVGHALLRVSGISARTLRKWVRSGRLKPAEEAETVDESVFAVVAEALAIATAACMRGRGLPRDVAGRALDVLLALDDMDVRVAFSPHSRYLSVSAR